MRYVSVTNVTTGTVLASQAAVAESFFARFLGLQFRRILPRGAGLVLLPSSSIHMFFMFMRIDAVFVSPENTVVRVAHRLRPWTVGPIVPNALYCIELPAGTAAGTEAGHTIELAQTAAF